MSLSRLKAAAVECENRTKDGWVWRLELSKFGAVLIASVNDGLSVPLRLKRVVSWEEIERGEMDALTHAMKFMEQHLRTGLRSRAEALEGVQA